MDATAFLKGLTIQFFLGLVFSIVLQNRLFAQSDTLFIINCVDDRIKHLEPFDSDLIDGAGYSYLDLRCNGIYSLEDIDLSKARYIDLSRNPLSEFNNVKLNELEFINLSYTDLRYFPNSVCFAFNLKAISINCSLSDLPDCLGGLKNLRSITGLVAENKSATNLDYLRKIENLEHLGLLILDFIPDNLCALKLKKLELVIGKNINLTEVIEIISCFENLIELKLVVSDKVLPENINLLKNLEVFIVQRDNPNSDDRLIYPATVSELSKLKYLSDAKNLKDISLSKGTTILPLNNSDERKIKKLGYRIDRKHPLLKD